MTKAQFRKMLELSLQFDRYAMRHPEIFDDIPYNAWIVTTDAKDEKMSRAARTMLIRSKDINLRKAVEIRKVGRSWKVLAIQPQG
jgi:hypothetical protein